eukprot:7021175-Ditylum_brightwellii.AAC.1
MEYYDPTSIWLASTTTNDSVSSSPTSILLTGLSYTVATALGIFLLAFLAEALKGGVKDVPKSIEQLKAEREEAQ